MKNYLSNLIKYGYCSIILAIIIQFIPNPHLNASGLNDFDEIIVASITGTIVDADGLPEAMAFGDDNNGVDDEDGVIIFYSLNYYGMAEKVPMKMWMYKSHPENHGELTEPLTAQNGPVLILNYYDGYQDELEEDFERLVPLPPLDIDLGGGKRRTLKLWAGYGYTPTKTR